MQKEAFYGFQFEENQPRIEKEKKKNFSNSHF